MGRSSDLEEKVRLRNAPLSLLCYHGLHDRHVPQFSPPFTSPPGRLHAFASGAGFRQGAWVGIRASCAATEANLA